MRQSITGLILSETVLRESDKFLTVLTAEYGKISLYANHVRSIKRGSFAYTVPMQYCRFEVNKKTDSYTLATGEVIHSFLDLQEDLSAFALAQYILDVTRELTVENMCDGDMLRLALNTLFVIQQREKPLDLIKATFEFRAMAQSGYLPDLSSCGICGGETGDTIFFDIMNGRLICADCQKKRNIAYEETDELGTAVIISILDPSMLRGLRYVLSAQANRVFSYSIAEDKLPEYAVVCEKYITNHLERGFLTLDFYHEVTNLPK